MPFEIVTSRRIRAPSLLGIVISTVHLNYKASLKTDEIGHVWTYRALTPKLHPLHLAIAQVPPELLLSIRY